MLNLNDFFQVRDVQMRGVFSSERQFPLSSNPSQQLLIDTSARQGYKDHNHSAKFLLLYPYKANGASEGCFLKRQEYQI